jgi:hypothetical protein
MNEKEYSEWNDACDLVQLSQDECIADFDSHSIQLENARPLLKLFDRKILALKKAFLQFSYLSNSNGLGVY